MNKAEFLHTLRVERAAWDALLTQVPVERMEEPGVAGEMSIKEIVYHVTWYERQMVEVLRSRALIGSPWWELPLDERNANILAEGRNTPLAEVLAEAGQVYEQLLAGLEELSDEELADARHFAEMPPDWLPWQVIASNCYEHYPQHAADLRGWLVGRSNAG
jgi:hypothetical protein